MSGFPAVLARQPRCFYGIPLAADSGMFTIGTVACLADPSERSIPAVRCAADLSYQYNARMIVLQPVGDLIPAGSFAAKIPFSNTLSLPDLNLSHLLDFTKSCIPANVHVEYRPVTSDHVFDVAEQEEADLLVLSSEHFGTFRWGLFRVPVLSVPAVREIPPRRILCAIEQDQNSLRTIQVAISVARSFQAKTFFVEFSDENSYSDQGTFGLRDIAELLAPEQQGWYTALSIDESKEASREILDLIEEREVDLAVMHHVSNGVASRIATNAACPVLLVPDKQ